MSRISLALPLLLLILAAPAAALQPVDDFDAGPFSLYAADGPVYDEIFIPNHSSHAIWSERKIWLNPLGGLVSAQTVTGGHPSDIAARIEIAGEGNCAMQWFWEYLGDLTIGGTVDRIEMELLAAPAGGTVRLTAQNDTHLGAWYRTTDGGPETLVWEYSEWEGSGVDPTSAKALGAYFEGEGGPFLVSCIRLRRTGGGPIDLVAHLVETQIPPIPSPPLRFEVWDLLNQPLFFTDIRIAEAHADLPPEISAHWEQWDALGGRVGAARFDWELLDGYAETRLALQFDFTPSDGLVPEAYPPDPIIDAKSFLLEFPVRVSEGREVVGTAGVRLQFEIPAEQGLEFQDVVVPLGEREWSGTLFADFRIVETEEGMDYALPLYEMTWLCDWAVETATGLPGDGFSLREGTLLSALPSVTRDGTQLLASRPFGAGARVTVHDVTGRRLRELTATAGERSLRWDGHDDTGRPTAAGVYFLRLSDESGIATARVLRLR